MNQTKENNLVSSPETHLVDDLYDGLVRDIVSRTISRQEGRTPGNTVVVETNTEGEMVVVGRRRSLDSFKKQMELKDINLREIEVDGFPLDPTTNEKLSKLIHEQVSEARQRRALESPELSLDAWGLLAAADSNLLKSETTSAERKGDGAV